jgi:hypothetical protein
MPSVTIFSSSDIKEVYDVCKEASASFLKHFKFQAEFGISHKTTEKVYSLVAHDVNSVEQKFLETSVLEISQKKLKKPIDGS